MAGTTAAQQDEMITLLLMDDALFRTRMPRRHVEQCPLLAGMLPPPSSAHETSGQGEHERKGECDEEIELPIRGSITRDIMLKIGEFLQHHVDHDFPTIETPLRSSNIEDVVPEWHAQYLKSMDRHTLFSVLRGANFLHVTNLVELCSAMIASMIKGKSPEEVRRVFNIVNDFTEEEEAQIREENRWAEEH